MIQINLLPDVKQMFIKTRRTKRLIILSSSIAAGAAITVLSILLLITDVKQSRSISKLDEQINSSLTELKSTKDLDKILTVQKQLGSLDELHNSKTDSTRLFAYLPQIIPSGITLSDFKIDYEANTVEISGSASTLGEVNIFVDTLKFTQYVVTEVDDESSKTDPAKAFADVVFSGNSRENEEVTFTITASFVSDIFLTSVDRVSLNVPNTVTTRSETEQPGALFEAVEGDGNE